MEREIQGKWEGFSPWPPFSGLTLDIQENRDNIERNGAENYLTAL